MIKLLSYTFWGLLGLSIAFFTIALLTSIYSLVGVGLLILSMFIGWVHHKTKKY